MHLRAPTVEELGPPDSDRASAGRANAAGISVLYAANDERTAIAEVRPHIGATVSIAKCVPRQECKLFDMTAERPLHGLDPFAPEFNQHERDASLLSILNEEFARPLALHIPEREYAPTQFVAEIIASHNYDGIKYRSAMNEAGVNYVFFRPRAFDYEYDRTISVTRIGYEWNETNPNVFSQFLDGIDDDES